MNGIDWVKADLVYGWRRFRDHLEWWLPAIIVFGLLAGASAWLLLGPLLLGVFFALEKMDKGEKPAFDDLFKGFSVFSAAFMAVVPLWVAMLVVFVLGVIAAILLTIVPAIGAFLSALAMMVALLVCMVLLMPLAAAAIYRVLRGETDGVDVAKRSVDATLERGKNLWQPTLVAALAIFILLGIGWLLFGLGLLVAGPMAMGMYFRLARRLFGENPEPAASTPGNDAAPKDGEKKDEAGEPSLSKESAPPAASEAPPAPPAPADNGPLEL